MKEHIAAINSNGQVFRVGDSVLDMGRRKTIVKIVFHPDDERRHKLMFADASSSWINHVEVCVDPPKPKPSRIIKFKTTMGPLFINLEEVACIYNCEVELSPPNVVIQFKSGSNLQLNPTFRDDLEKFMDAWAEFKNAE